MAKEGGTGQRVKISFLAVYESLNSLSNAICFIGHLVLLIRLYTLHLCTSEK